jgi:L-ascorbate metabolism protein UlaG (beta-lactamase superfamily)
MIAPFRKDDALLAALAEPLPVAHGLRITWLGQSGFLVQCAGFTALLDPYLSDSLTRKYAATDKPHVRMTERVVAPERLTGIDVITSSHNHTDHLDSETLLPLLAANPEAKLVIPKANRDFVAERLGMKPEALIGIDDGKKAVLAGFEFTGIAAAHNAIDRDDAGHCRYLGYVVQRGPWTIYHSGDTLLYPGLAEKPRAVAPIDVALLPINGNKPERRVAGNLDGREAAQLAHDIGARWVVPCHYEMFEFNTADPRELFTPECERLGQPFKLLGAGESWDVDEPLG